MPDNLFELTSETTILTVGLLNDCAVGMEWSSSMNTWFKTFDSAFDSIRSVLQIVKEAGYKDCFIILRSVFETYFLLLLMVRGKKYRETRKYRILPEGSSTPKEARDATYEKWSKEWKSGNTRYGKVRAIDKGHAENVIHVTFEFEGLYDAKDVDKKGQTVPIFVFVLEQYNPDVHFLADLPTVSHPPMPAYRDIVETQKHLYSQFLNIDKIETNILLNGLLTSEQTDRFWVHYNFLSSFTHPTQRALNLTPPLSYGKPRMRDAVLEELVLQYLAHFEAMLVRVILDHFSQKNPRAKLGKYEEQARKLEQTASDFWFMYNNPGGYDNKESDSTKSWMKMRGMAVPETTLYYNDPIERARKLAQE